MKNIRCALWFFLVLILTGCKANPPPEYPGRQKMIHHLNESTIVLMAPDEEDETYRTICTGVWISETQFLSARHCAETKIQTFISRILHQPANLSRLPGIIMPFKTYSQVDDIFKLKDENHKPYFAVVTGYDPKNDLVLFESIDVFSHDKVNISKDKLWNGQPLHVIGHTIGHNYTYLQGYISYTDRHMKPFGEEWHLTQVSGFVWSGNSGGGAFDEAGNLIGIASFVKGNAPAMSFFVHKEEIMNFLENEKVQLP